MEAVLNELHDIFCFSFFIILFFFLLVSVFFFFFFFFQAEDGIRDTSVTGVQTCALPISVEQANLLRTVLRQHSGVLGPEIPVQQRLRPPELGERARPVVPFVGESLQPRSEERRVGKGGRCRWGAAHYRETQ